MIFSVNGFRWTLLPTNVVRVCFPYLVSVEILVVTLFVIHPCQLARVTNVVPLPTRVKTVSGTASCYASPNDYHLAEPAWYTENRASLGREPEAVERLEPHIRPGAWMPTANAC